MTDHQEDIPKEYLAEQQANFCRIFSNARRVRILWVLMERELPVGAIAEAVGSSPQNVSQHLSKMKDYKLVSSRREGQMIYYRIETEALADQCWGLLRANNPESNLKTLDEKQKLKGVL